MFSQTYDQVNTRRPFISYYEYDFEVIYSHPKTHPKGLTIAREAKR